MGGREKRLLLLLPLLRAVWDPPDPRLDRDPGLAGVLGVPGDLEFFLQTLYFICTLLASCQLLLASCQLLLTSTGVVSVLVKRLSCSRWCVHILTPVAHSGLLFAPLARVPEPIGFPAVLPAAGLRPILGMCSAYRRLP